jgi:ADP-heptose:LPS heptosyltransferase
MEKQFLELIQSSDLKGARRLLKEQESRLKPWEVSNYEGALERLGGNLAAAEIKFRLACGGTDSNPAPYMNLSQQLVSVGRHGEAIVYAKKAFELKQNSKNAVTYLTCLLDQAKTEEALKVLDVMPDSFRNSKDGQMVLAACLRQQGKLTEACELLHKYLSIVPSDAHALRMLADAIGEENSLDAIPFYERSLAIRESHATKWNMSMHLLRVRSFELGWRHYESGYHPDVGTLGRKLPVNPHDLKLFKPSDPIDSTKYTIVSAEQGIGDQVLFLSVMDEVLKEFKKILFICEPRFEQIVRRSFPKIETVSQGYYEYLKTYRADINGFIPMGSLMQRYRSSLEDFMLHRKSYLTADRKAYEHFRNILKQEAKGRPIIGISWKGGFWENQQRNKALEIESWLPLFEKDFLCVNLQYGKVDEELAFLKAKGKNVIHFKDIDFKKDLDNWLAIAAACDGIISVSTALVHFAGAVGQKVGVVMPNKQGPWILGLNDYRSIVYPNVFIYRREIDETIASLVDRVGQVIKT